MSDTATMIWMEQAMATPSNLHSRSTARVRNCHPPTFLDDTFRSQVLSKAQRGRWCAGTAPLLRAAWDTALWKSDDFFLGSTTCFLVRPALRKALTPHVTDLAAVKSIFALHLPHTLHFFAHCSMRFFVQPGAEVLFLFRGTEMQNPKKR